MTFGRPDPNYDRYRAGHGIPASRSVHPLDFGRKREPLAPPVLPPICPSGVCRMAASGPSCDLTKNNCCRLMTKPGQSEPRWPMAPRT